jgi:hypothetical protein
VVGPEVLDNVNNVEEVGDLVADALETDPNDWCYHICNKKHHIIQHAA